MKKGLLNNGLFLSLLTAGILAVVGFGLKTYQQLGIQEAKIAALEKQSERLTDAMTMIWQEMWGQ